MNREWGSMEKRRGSGDGAKLPSPLSSHLFSFGPFVTDILDFGCQPKALGN